VVKETGAAHGEFARIGLSAQDGLMFKAINGGRRCRLRAAL